MSVDDSTSTVLENLSSTQTRHSKEDALDDREVELLLEGAGRLRAPYNREARFAILVMGRLGLRLGELTHIRESWIDWRNRRLQIPRHQPCSKGQDGGLCGLCKQQMRQQVDHNDDLTVEDVRPQMWRSKTDAAAREISFAAIPRLEIAIERHFDEHDDWPYSHTAIRRRVKRSAEESNELSRDDVYPHCLRATCASDLASKDMPALKLKGIMGWASLDTSENYVAQSPASLERAMHNAHSR